MKKLITGLLALVGLAIGGLVALYFLAPATFAEVALALERSRVGLEEREIRVGDFTIRYLEGGQGETLLLVHGFGADKSNWIRIAGELTDHYRIVAPDLPGYGESSHPIEADYDILTQVKRLRAFAEALELPASHVAGNSMGGAIAGMYGATYPADVRSLWLLAPAGVASAPTSELRRMVEQGENPLVPSTKQEYYALLDMVFEHPPFVPGGIKEVLAERAIRRHDLLAKQFRQINEDTIALETALAGSPTPALIVWGEQDRLLHVGGARILGDAMLNARVVLLDDTGHVPMMERPQATANAFRNFEKTLED